MTSAICYVRGDGISRTELLRTLSISEHFATQARIVRFPDGAYCEVDDSAALGRMLRQTDHRSSIAEYIGRSWKKIAGALVLLMGILTTAYVWGLPLAARLIADRVPVTVLSYITKQSLSVLDQGWLHPSKLPHKRQERVRALLAKVKLPPGPGPQPKIIFRDSPALGANAFALPDGTILIIDRLVEIAGNNRKELIAVYAHEVGHVHHRHALRQLIQNSVVSAFLAVYLGDVSSIAGALAGMVLQSKYSRDFERMADRYAAEVLMDNGLPPEALGTMLKKIEASNKVPGARQDDAIPDYISTHPSTEERMKDIKAFTGRRAQDKDRPAP